MKHYLTALIFMLLSFVGTSVAFAQSDTIIELAQPVLQAIMGGQYALAAALALVLAVALLRRYGVGRWPALGTAAAGSILVLVGGFGAALATSLLAGSALSGGLAYSALKLSVLAAGGFSIAKPLLAWLQGKAPAWASPAFKLVSWIFDKPSKVERAEAAGDAAVEANPGEGTGIEFKDFK